MIANVWLTVRRGCFLDTVTRSFQNFSKTITFKPHSLPFSTTSRLIVQKKIDKSLVPQVDEKDLDEKYLHGSGPGGQCVNKSWNACQLKHKPTGIVVKVHQDRSLDTNRKIARDLLKSKLDQLFNGVLSVEQQKLRMAQYKMQLRKNSRKQLKQLKQSHKKLLASQQKPEGDDSPEKTDGDSKIS